MLARLEAEARADELSSRGLLGSGAWRAPLIYAVIARLREIVLSQLIDKVRKRGTLVLNNGAARGVTRLAGRRRRAASRRP